MESEDKKQLKKLIKKYESHVIIEEVHNICNEYYTFWKKQVDIEHNTIEKTSNSNNKLKIIKKANNVIVSKSEDVPQINSTHESQIDEEYIQKEEVQIEKCTDTNTICPDTSPPPKKNKSNSDIKKEQREKEAQKRAELDKKGISINSLLTEQNLKQWIINENRTYAYIARELVGCSEDMVSVAARSLGIKSSVTAKKRAIMYANR